MTSENQRYLPGPPPGEEAGYGLLGLFVFAASAFRSGPPAGGEGRRPRRGEGMTRR